MKLQSNVYNVAPRTLSKQQPPVAPPHDPQGDNPQPDGFSWKPVLAGAGGAAVGFGAGVAASVGTAFVSEQLGALLNATMPTLGHLPVGTGAILLHGAAAALLGSTVAVAAGATVGSKIASEAARGAEKPSVTEGSNAKGVSKYQQYAAELRENVSSIGSASTVKSAAAAGFRAGQAIGGPAGAPVGLIQGTLVGAALGGIAALPLLSLVSHPAVLIPGAIAGALVGAKIGEPVGYATGALAAGTAGALGGAAYRAIKGAPEGTQGAPPPPPQS